MLKAAKTVAERRGLNPPPSPHVAGSSDRYPDGVKGTIEWLRRQAEKAFAVKNDSLCNNFNFAADALEYLATRPSKRHVTDTISRRDLLQRMSFALDDLPPNETIGYSNGVGWIEVATVEEIRRAAKTAHDAVTVQFLATEDGEFNGNDQPDPSPSPNLAGQMLTEPTPNAMPLTEQTDLPTLTSSGSLDGEALNPQWAASVGAESSDAHLFSQIAAAREEGRRAGLEEAAMYHDRIAAEYEASAEQSCGSLRNLKIGDKVKHQRCAMAMRELMGAASCSS